MKMLIRAELSRLHEPLSATALVAQGMSCWWRVSSGPSRAPSGGLAVCGWKSFACLEIANSGWLERAPLICRMSRWKVRFASVRASTSLPVSSSCSFSNYPREGPDGITAVMG